MTAIATRPSPATLAIAAGIALAVAMGIGRFAFTGMYPLMLRDGVMTVGQGSLAASANYAGYLIGALAVSRTHAASASYLCRLGLAVTIASLAALAWPGPIWLFYALRFAAGVASAIAMVSAAAWLFQIVDHPQGAPLLFAGVGLGILISAELIAAGNASGASSALLWLVLAAAAAILSALVWPPLARHTRPCPRAPAAPALAAQARPEAPLPASLGPWQLIASYGLAGFGYIITATYLPLFVRDALGNIDPVHIWAAFGIGAIPSCFWWHTLNRRLGSRRAMTLNLLVQAAGVILPTLSHGVAANLASALLVGGTFMGTVTIAMPAAKRIAATVPFNMLAALTAAYGAGQVAGPLVSNWLYAYAHSFNLPLAAASLALVIAAALCLFGTRKSRPVRTC